MSYKGHSHNEYSICHPWYYFLGGRVLSPKEIWQSVKIDGYRGYAKEDIEQADKQTEPKRTHKLRALRQQFYADLRDDLALYRQYALSFHRQKEGHIHLSEQSICREIDTDMSLKTSHLINDFAHLIWLDELLFIQPDLFDF